MSRQESPNKAFHGQRGLERYSEIKRVAEQYGHGFLIQAREPIAERELFGSAKTARACITTSLTNIRSRGNNKHIKQHRRGVEKQWL